MLLISNETIEILVEIFVFTFFTISCNKKVIYIYILVDIDMIAIREVLLKMSMQ